MMRWYDTNGTPELSIRASYSPAKQTLTLTVNQELETAKAPLLIPLKVWPGYCHAGRILCWAM
jgi:aminopeptidase N